MSDHMDLERRLRRVADDMEPPSAHKEALRAALQRRAARRRRERPVTVVLAIAAVAMVTFTGTKHLGGYRFHFEGAQRVGEAVQLKPHEDSGEFFIVTGRDSTISVEEAVERSRQYALVKELHMAGMTRLKSVYGHTIMGKDCLTATYESGLDSMTQTYSETVIDETMEDMSIAKLDYDFAFSGEYRDTWLEFGRNPGDSLQVKYVMVDGESILLLGRTFMTDDYGPVTMWAEPSYLERTSRKN